jgi:hypothetical protein
METLDSPCRVRTLPERQTNSHAWLGGGTQKDWEAESQIRAEIGRHEQGGKRPFATASAIQ